MKRYFWILLAAAVTLVSCQKREQAARPSGLGEVRFTTSLDRYSVKATDTAFEAGDEVGIFAGAPIGADNVKAAVSGSSLTPETPIRWVEEDNGVVSFYAYCPYAAGAVKAYPFTVAANQSALADYKKSDLLIASAKSAPTENAVALNFHHALSKVAVSIDNQIAGTTVSKVEFRNVALGATIDLESGAVSNVSSDLQTVQPLLTDTGCQLLIVPQTAQPEIQVTLSSGAAFRFTLDAAFTFGAGKKAAASLVIKEAAAVSFSFTIVDWDDEEAPVNFVENEEPGNGWNVVGLGGDWDLGIPMTCTEPGEGELEGVWEADITYAAGESFKLRSGDLWAGMKANWAYYGTGEFEDGYLDATDAGINIVLEAAGEYHLKFTWPSCRFVITKTGDGPDTPPVDPENVVWKVRGLGGDWTWENAVAMTCTTPGENAGEGVWEADITYAATDSFKICNSGDDATATWCGMMSHWSYYGLGDFEDAYLDATPAGKDIIIGTGEGEGDAWHVVPLEGKFHLTFEWPSCHFVITEVASE